MWEQIRANRRRSFFLITGLFLVLAALGYFAGEGFVGEGAGVLGIMAAAFIWLMQMLIYYVAGEAMLLMGLGAKEMAREDSPRLFNIVDEMQIASGFSHTPKIYLVSDSAPNAFAIGRKPERSAIGVTTGLLYRLKRDELQGVVGHEMAHLVNRDTQFMTLAGVTLGTIIMFSELIRDMARWGPGRVRSRSSSREGGQAQVLFLLLALLVAILGPLVAQILYFACSRTREYLADACSAQYTRYPDGLAAALERIARADSGLVVSRAIAPMFIINPMIGDDAEPHGLFSTHPPTGQRCKVLRSMGGASLADYNAAFQQTTGKSVIGWHSLSTAAPASIRAASEEGDGNAPVESRQAAKSTIHRLYGYMEITCDCGMIMRVPETFEEDDINCMRCNNRMALPCVKERYARYLEKSAPPPKPPAEPMEYERKGTGWESFRCGCGATVQLSPQFAAPRIFCPKCRGEIKIAALAGV